MLACNVALMTEDAPSRTRYLWGAELQRRRKEAGLTQEALAALVRVDQARVAHWEADDDGCDIKVIVRLAAALPDCKPTDLMHEEGRTRYRRAGGGMKDARFLRYERNIAASDTGGILERWSMGRDLLADTKRITPAGNLKHGVLAELIDKAARRGFKITEREIQRRMACARAYKTEAEIRHAVTDFETWHDLVAAGFPAGEISLDAEADSFDPRDADEKRRDAARELARRTQEDGGQLALFDYYPDDKFTELSTLAELAKYADEMAALTERYARKDRERAAYLASLIEAVNGDMSATWERANAALEGAA